MLIWHRSYAEVNQKTAEAAIPSLQKEAAQRRATIGYFVNSKENLDLHLG